MCLFGSCAPVHTQKNLMWCFACWPGPGESQSHKVTNSSCIFAAERLTRSAFPLSFHTTLFCQMGVVRSSCSFSLFSSDHFWSSSVSPKTITITLQIMSEEQHCGQPFSHFLGSPPWWPDLQSCGTLLKMCFYWGSVGCHGGILHALYSIRWGRQFTRWAVPWSRGDMDSASALQAVWLQQVQCQAVSHG